MVEVKDVLFRRWMGLWRRIGAQGSARQDFEDLVRRYSESRRAFHTLERLSGCLAEFKACAQLAINPESVELAIWFQDAICNPRAFNNKECSAQLAEDFVRRVSLSYDFARRVGGLILVTRHDAISLHPDGRLIADIDLAGLGKDGRTFNRIWKLIRKEYDWVAENDFLSCPLGILRSFMQPTIYGTEFFRKQYEKQAHLNISRLLAKCLN